MDRELTQTQTALTAWRQANGKAHLPQSLKNRVIVLTDHYSLAELSQALSIPRPTLSYWKRQADVPPAPAINVSPMAGTNDFVELEPCEIGTDQTGIDAIDDSCDSDSVELFLRSGTIRVVMSMGQFQAFVAQEVGA